MDQMLKISVLFAMLIIVARFTKAPDPYHDKSILEETNPNFLKSPISNDSIRLKRSANDLDFDSFVKKMKMPGRVFAGISLEIGFIDDSIPTDEALAELMNLDGVTLGNLEEFKQNRINDFFSKLKNLKLDVSQELNDLRETIKLVNSWVTVYSKINNPKDIEAVGTYVQQLQKLKNNKFNFNDLGAIVKGNKLNKILTGLEYFKTIEKSKDGENIKKSTLTLLGGDLGGLETETNSMISMNQLANENLVLTEKLMLSACEFTNLYAEFLSKTDKLKLNTPSVDSLINSFRGVSNMSQSFKDSTTDFLSLLKTMQSIQKRRYPFPRTHTSGLTEGHHDLREISNLVKDPFFKSTIGDFKWEIVESGLKSLNLIAEKSGHLEEKWKTLEQLNILEELQKLLSNYEKLSKVTANSDNIVDLIKPVLDFKDIKLSNVHKESKEMCADLSVFNQKTNAVISALKESVKTKLFENSKIITELYNLIDPENDKNDLNTILKNMKKFTKLDQFIGYLNVQTAYFEKIGSSLKDFDFDKSMENILNNYNKISALIKDKDAGKFIDCFEQLKRSSKSLNSVSDAVSVTTEMQKIKKDNDFFTNIATATKIIGESLPALEDLRSVSLSIKKNQNAEVKELMKLKDFRKILKKFGDALEGIVHLKRVMDAQKKFDQLLKEGQHIDNEIRKLNDHELVQEIQKSWGDFKVLKKKVEELKAMLEDKKKIFGKDRSKRSLEDFSQYFTGMAGLVDFDLDISQKLKGIKNLDKERDSQDIDVVLNVLGDLETLDLHFSKFNKVFSAMPTTLKEIQAALQNVLNPVITNTPTLQPSPSPNPGNGPSMPINPSQQSKPSPLQSTNATSNTEDKSSNEWVWWPVPVSFVGGIFAAIFLISLFFYCRRRRNPINEKSVKKQMKLKYKDPKDVQEEYTRLLEAKERAEEDAYRFRLQNEILKQTRTARTECLENQIKRLQNQIKQNSEMKQSSNQQKKSDEVLNQRLKKLEDDLKTAKKKLKKTEDNLAIAKIKEEQAIVLLRLTSCLKDILDKMEGSSYESKKVKTPTEKIKRCWVEGGLLVFAKVPAKFIEEFNVKNRCNFPDKEFEKKHKEGTLTRAYYGGILKLASDGTNYILKEWTSITKSSIRNRNVIWRKLTKVPVFEETGVKGKRKEYYVSANYFLMPSTTLRSHCPIIAQLPFNRPHYLFEFWLMIMLEKPDDMLFINHAGNTEYNYPRELDEKKTYDDRFEVKVTKKEEEEGYVFRQLRLEDTKTKNVKEIDHHEFTAWPDDKIPTTEAFREIFKKVYRKTRRKSGKKLLVYDKEGSFKAATFLSVEYIAQLICYQFKDDWIVPDLSQLIAKVLTMRGNVFTDAKQIMFILTIVLEILYEDAGIEIPEHLERKWKLFKNFDDKDEDQELRDDTNKSLQKTQSVEQMDVEQGLRRNMK